MSNTLLGGLMGVGIALPLVMAGIARVVDGNNSVALWPKIVFPLFWLAAVFVYSVVGMESDIRFDDISAYWMFGGIACLVGGGWLLDTYFG